MATAKTTKKAAPTKAAEPDVLTPSTEGQMHVKLNMPLWDSKKQKPFTVGELYPCTEQEAQRLIDSGVAVKADA